MGVTAQVIPKRYKLPPKRNKFKFRAALPLSSMAAVRSQERTLSNIAKILAQQDGVWRKKWGSASQVCVHLFHVLSCVCISPAANKPQLGLGMHTICDCCCLRLWVGTSVASSRRSGEAVLWPLGFFVMRSSLTGGCYATFIHSFSE